MNESIETQNSVQIDLAKAQRLLQKLIMLEKRNLMSKQFNDTEMVEKIKKMIKEEVECY